MQRTDYLTILRVLTRHKVDSIVVGGVAAILEGAPIVTFDVDFVFSPATENLERLLGALLELRAVYRDPGGRVIEPTIERLRQNRMNLLRSPSGLLDAMRVIAPGWGYDELLPKARRVLVEDVELLVLDLASIIESKTAAGRPKDIAVLHVLLNTLAMRERSRGRP